VQQSHVKHASGPSKRQWEHDARDFVQRALRHREARRLGSGGHNQGFVTQEDMVQEAMACSSATHEQVEKQRDVEGNLYVRRLVFLNLSQFPFFYYIMAHRSCMTSARFLASTRTTSIIFLVIS